MTSSRETTHRSPVVRRSSSQHPLFRTMVVMGGSAALSCGGVVSEDSPGAGGTTTGAGPGGAGGSGVGGAGGTQPGGAGVGGFIIGGSGGASGFGGTGGTVTLVEPGPFPCAPAAWDCSQAPQICETVTYQGQYPSGWRLPEGCLCDDTRPTSAEDCAEGEQFVCRNGISLSSTELLAEAVPFECACVPRQAACGDACQVAFEDLQFFDGVSCVEGDDVALCQCAWVFLK